MLQSGVPAVERRAAWLLSLRAQARGDPAQARQWLGALGEKERLSIFPLAPLDPAGGSQPHENRMPFLVMNYCIALQGIFPSRN